MYSEIKRGLKSNSVRSGQPTYEACDGDLDARIEVAPIKFILTINNLVNTIEVPTRVTTATATLLDLIIVPDSKKKKRKKYLTQM